MNVSKIAKRGLLYTQTGTPYYASPEVWNDKPYDSKSDIWSLGCVIYEMASLKPPFRAEDMEGLYKRVIKGKFKKLPSHFSVDLNNFVKLMLRVNPHQRPSAEKLLAMPMITKRLEQNLLMEPEEPLIENMLKTIRMPNDVHYLTDRLPQANYNPIKTKVSGDFSKGIHKMTMPNLKDSGGKEKLGSESKSLFLKEIKLGPKEKSRLEKSPDRKKKIANKAHERVIGATRGEQGVSQSQDRREASRDMPKKGHRRGVSNNLYLKKEHNKIEAQIEKYNLILKNQKNKNRGRKGNNIKQKIELILGREKSKVGKNIRSNDNMRVYGRGLNYSSVPNVKIKPKKLPKMKSKVKYTNLPRLY